MEQEFSRERQDKKFKILTHNMLKLQLDIMYNK